MAIDERTSPAAEPADNQAQRERLHAAVTNHYDFVWRVLRRLGVETGQVDDAAQEVFIVVSAKLASVPSAQERSYVFAVALRVAAHARRTQRRKRELSVDVTQSDLADGSPRQDELLDECRARQVVDEILETMPLDQRAVFVLFEMEDMTMLQISELLEIPLGTVASRLRRSRQLFFEAVHRRRARASCRGL